VTTTVKDWLSLSGGAPSSVTVTVIRLVDGPGRGPAAHVNSPWPVQSRLQAVPLIEPKTRRSQADPVAGLGGEAQDSAFVDGASASGASAGGSLTSPHLDDKRLGRAQRRCAVVADLTVNS
jgi:hypothetical protein